MFGRLFLSSLVLLSACTVRPDGGAPERVKLGMYPNYRVMLQGELYRQTRDQDFAKCGADFVLANVTPAELQHLDRYARGEESISSAEMRSMDDDFRSRVGDATREDLRPFCPDTVDSFRIPG